MKTNKSTASKSTELTDAPEPKVSTSTPPNYYATR
ncbi:unknown [Bacteroides sp. CAG:927]|nr:unknown [Bacteroides sp. CAG:927]